MPSPAEILKALDESLKHWYNNALGNYEGHGAIDCALCDLFIMRPVSCDGCPIREASGQVKCRGTPYQAYEYHMRPKMYLTLPDKVRHASKPAATQLAWAEHKFINNVRSSFLAAHPELRQSTATQNSDGEGAKTNG